MRAFEEELTLAYPYEQFIAAYLCRRGWIPLPLIRESGEPDCGDISIGKVIDDVFITKIVDVKHNKYWRSIHWSYDTIFLCTVGNFHPEWWYFVLNPQMTRIAFIDGSEVPPDMITSQTTINHRGKQQESLEVPVGCAIFIDV